MVFPYTNSDPVTPSPVPQLPGDLNNIFMSPAQANGVMNMTPAAMFNQQQSLQPYTQPQTPPELQHLEAVGNQFIQNRQDQQANNGLLQSILSQRTQAAPQISSQDFQPQLEDASRSIIQTQQAFGAPDLFKPITAQQAANERVSSELAPYTTGLDLGAKQAALQKAQIENQYAPEMEQAKTQALKAQSGIFNSGNGGATPGQPQISGEAFLQTLNPQQAAQVKALSEGRMQFPAGFALKSPYWQQMISAVSQYDPGFDAINFNARAKTRADFTSGKSAQSINALNTVIGHMKVLSDAADNLHNTSIPAVNSALNWGAQAVGDPRIQQFNATKKAVVDELTRVYRGSGGSEGDIQTWSQQINDAGSPDQLHGVIAQIGDLLESKVNALGEQYNQGMGTTANPIRLMTPNAQSSLETLRQRAGQTQQSNSGVPTSGSNRVVDFNSLPK